MIMKNASHSLQRRSTKSNYYDGLRLGIMDPYSLEECQATSNYIEHRGAAIAQWIRLRLPSYHPGFESQAHYLCFYHFILICVMWKRRK